MSECPECGTKDKLIVKLALERDRYEQMEADNDSMHERLRVLEPTVRALEGFIKTEAAYANTLIAALHWYRQRAIDCRKHGPEGDKAREELNDDMGKVADKALKGEALYESAKSPTDL